jgi:TolB-like protein
LAEGDASDQVNGAETAALQAALSANPAGAVFISYASQDIAVADAVVATLEGHGVGCWIAPRDVKAGALYAEAIVRAISDAKALVLVLSANSVVSTHVGKEVERASSKRRPVIALRIDEAPLSPALEYFLGESQWVDARAGSMDAALTKLIAAIREPERSAPGIMPAMTPGKLVRAASAPPPRSRGKRTMFAAGVAVLALGLAGLLVGKFWLSRQLTPQQPTTAATNVASDKSIAVLPFTDMSETKDQQYFADGMAEEILDLLAKVPGLAVIGRTSSFQFKGKDVDLRTIGTQLNAAHVLEGSVRNSGDQVRITAQLIDTRTGTHEWSETYDRRIGDVLKLQDAIAAAVAREMQLTVVSGGSRATLKDADAYDLMLRARHAADRWDEEGLDEAVALLQQALDRDATSPGAAAELAFTFYKQGAMGFVVSATAFEQARRAAAAALTLDSKNRLAHYVLGKIHIVYDWDWVGAERELQQVATLAPGSADALAAKARLSLTLGRWDDGLRQAKAALAMDPLDPNTFQALTVIQLGGRHLPEAEAAMRRALAIRPTFGQGHYLLGRVLLERGDRNGALLEMQQETADEVKQEGLAMTYYALGRKADSDAALAHLLKEHADEDASGIAQVYAFRGQLDEAVHWLERAYAQKDPYLCYIESELRLRSLTADPRFKAFLRKMNLPE